MKKILSFLTAVLLIALATSTFAQKAQGSQNREKNPKRIVNALELNDQQQENFDKIKFEHQKTVLEFKNQIERNALEISQMMKTNNVDANKLIGLTSSNSELKASIKESRVNMWLDIYNILDENQQEKWAKGFLKAGRTKQAGRKGNAMNQRMNRGSGRVNCMNRTMRGNF